MGDVLKHLSRSECGCKCGCGFNAVDVQLLNVLEDIRTHFSKPVINCAAAVLRITKPWEVWKTASMSRASLLAFRCRIPARIRLLTAWQITTRAVLSVATAYTRTSTFVVAQRAGTGNDYIASFR